ncbi:unnamed protein product [Linum trigynum]|uniref:Uncharacterized protein n=1 Tax=Linum trigynum TaxID=586398 RepID=A0AAV2DQ91_9ROSI
MCSFEKLSDLELLESLTLQSSHFTFSGTNEPQEDPFANFSRLKKLQLLHCSSVSGLPHDYGSYHGFVVSGPQLLYLEIHRSQFGSIEIRAPKLKSFTYWTDVLPRLLPTDGSKWNLPSLSHAKLNLCRSKGVISCFNAEQKQVLLKQCVNLFHGLRDVESLSLHMDTIELLIQACDSVKHQPSPFRRLKSLSLLYSNGSFSRVPYQVMRFFLEGSPNVDDKYLTIDKRPRAKARSHTRRDS